MPLKNRTSPRGLFTFTGKNYQNYYFFREKFWQALPVSDRVFPQSSIITLPLYYCNIVVCIRKGRGDSFSLKSADKVSCCDFGVNRGAP